MSTELIPIHGFIQAIQHYDGRVVYSFSTCEDMAEYGYLTIMPYILQFALPADFNIVSAKVEMLRKKKQSLMDEFNKRTQQINEEISKLTCIEASK